MEVAGCWAVESSRLCSRWERAATRRQGRARRFPEANGLLAHTPDCAGVAPGRRAAGRMLSRCATAPGRYETQRGPRALGSAVASPPPAGTAREPGYRLLPLLRRPCPARPSTAAPT